MQDGKNDYSGGQSAEDERDYADLLMLEEMESLLEELEDMGVTGDLHGVKLPDDLAALVGSLNVHSITDLKARISNLHATLDGREQQ